jgi:hypothetical protein
VQNTYAQTHAPAATAQIPRHQLKILSPLYFSYKRARGTAARVVDLLAVRAGIISFASVRERDPPALPMKNVK